MTRIEDKLFPIFISSICFAGLVIAPSLALAEDEPEADGKPTITWTAHDSGDSVPNSDDYYCTRDETYPAGTEISDGNKERIQEEVDDWCEEQEAYAGMECEGSTWKIPGTLHLICGGAYGKPGSVPADWSARASIVCDCTEPEPPAGGNGGGGANGTGTTGTSSSVSLELSVRDVQFLLSNLQ